MSLARMAALAGGAAAVGGGIAVANRGWMDRLNERDPMAAVNTFEQFSGIEKMQVDGELFQMLLEEAKRLELAESQGQPIEMSPEARGLYEYIKSGGRENMEMRGAL